MASDTIAGIASIRQGRIRVGPYRILRVLGRGGMGTVYQAEVLEDAALAAGTLVAIKVLRRVDGDDRRRFLREVGYLQALRHPGIVPVLDSGAVRGRPYLVMPFLAGSTLDLRLAERRHRGDRAWDPHAAADLCAQALEALHTAHLAGILHRDLKPGNLLVGDDGRIRILDFGLAMSLERERESGLTRSDICVGTPAYMAPEQALGGRADLSRATDVYALGACLYELLCLEQPIAPASTPLLLAAVAAGRITPLRARRPDVPRPLERIVQVALARNPRDRFPTAEAMAADLRRFLRGERVRARPVGALVRGVRMVWRRRHAIALSGLAAFVPVAVLAIAWRAMASSAAPVWIVEWRQDGPAATAPAPPSGRLAPLGVLVGAPAIGPGAVLATLPDLGGAARISCAIEAAAPARVDLGLADPDLGQGYRAVLQRSDDGDRIVVHRGGLELASTDVPEPVRRLRLSVVGGAITVEREDGAGWSLVLGCDDLIPVAGTGAWAAVAAGPATIADLTLERTRTPLVASPLSQADLLFQEGRWVRAMRLYEHVIRDHPDAAAADEARLRVALCLAAIGDHATALGRLTALANDAGRSDRDRLVATVHAWAAALHLGRYDEADAFLATVRSGFPLSTILTTVPAGLVADLLENYLDRAEARAPGDAAEARRLAVVAADLADHVGNRRVLGRARVLVLDLDLQIGDDDRVVEQGQAAAADVRLPGDIRRGVWLRVGHAERLRGDPEAALAAYAAAAGNDDIGRWAMFWEGDILADVRDPLAALMVWSEGAHPSSAPGRLLAALVLESQPPDPTAWPDDRAVAAYAAARWHVVHDHPGAEDALAGVLAVAAGAPLPPVIRRLTGL
jgi:tetratricopeptide (TPR) repeat protein